MCVCMYMYVYIYIYIVCTPSFPASRAAEVSSYDAFSKSHWNGLDKNATPRVLRGKWDLFEDRAGGILSLP